MSNSVSGVDVSSWQHEDNKPIDWEKVYGAGYRFAIIKATQGSTYFNPWVLKDISDANAAGLLVGAYHYFEAGDDPAAQAKWFVSNLVMQQLDLGVFVDWECYSPAVWTFNAEITGFLSEARLTRPQCGVYCSIAWAAVLEQEKVNVGRLWLATDGQLAIPNCFAWQYDHVTDVDGIPGPVNKSHIMNKRGLDIPTAPPAKAPAEPLYSLKESEEAAVIPAEDDETNPTDEPG